MEPLKELEKELNSFPKNLNMDQKAKNKIYQAITQKSRASRKSTRRVRTPLKVWLVGLATVAVACMLFLPSILKNDSPNRNKHVSVGQANPPSKPVGQPNQPSKPNNPDQSNQQKDHPATNQGTVKEILITNSKDGSRSYITDSKVLKNITNKIESSTYFGKADQVKDDGSNYSLTFTVKDGSFYEFSFGTNQKPNLFDIQKQEWRQSDTLQSILTPYLPTKILDEQQIRTIAQKLYPSGHFDTEVGARLADNKPLGLPGNQVWIIEGTNKNNERIKAYLDPKDGSVIKEDPLVTTDGVRAVVETFFKDVANKNIADAWTYIHSKAKHPNPAAKETEIQKRFTSYVQKSNTKLKSIESVKWELVWNKSPDCMCSIEDSVVVNAIMSDNTTKRFHVLLDTDHKWKLFYSLTINDVN